MQALPLTRLLDVQRVPVGAVVHRSHEARLGEVVEAYNHLRRLPAFA